MKSPDNKSIEYLQEGKMKENREALQAVIQKLKEVAEKFRSLKAEATMSLLDPEDLEGYKEKLEERAILLVNLPDSLAGTLEQINPQVRNKIESYIKVFATTAQERIDNGEEVGLATLLVDKGSKKDDKNDLEKLIDSFGSE